MKLQFYEVTWIDSESDDGWETIENSKFADNTVLSYGFIIKENEDFILLASDWDKSEKHFNRRMSIPKVAIKRKRKIKI